MRIVKGALREYHLKIPKIRDLRVTPYIVRKELVGFLGAKLSAPSFSIFSPDQDLWV